MVWESLSMPEQFISAFKGEMLDIHGSLDPKLPTKAHVWKAWLLAHGAIGRC
jgi:folate-dependent phosphoribosylglycinamide formyltransferase PurN